MKKIFALCLIILVLFIILGRVYQPAANIKFGVTFSPRYARYLGLDWQKTYLKILDELKVKSLRLTSYWDILEKEPQQYDFSETDFMLDEAQKRETGVILVIGARQPRWPECQYPVWAKTLSVEQRQQATLQFVQKVVERYKDNQSIWAWQVENEPFAFWFGENCDAPNKKFLQEEINLVKQLDPKRPIIVTDSGEWGTWIDSLSPADILGISVYRESYNPTLNLYTTYPILPGMYALKGSLVKKWSGAENKKIMVTELQTEPWLAMKDEAENTPEKQSQLFTPADFKANIEYAKKTGFDEYYLWGVEWWYFMDKQGYPQYLDFAKQLF